MCQFSCGCLSWLPELASQKAQKLPSKCEVQGASLTGTLTHQPRAEPPRGLPSGVTLLLGFGIRGLGLVRV